MFFVLLFELYLYLLCLTDLEKGGASMFFFLFKLTSKKEEVLCFSFCFNRLGKRRVFVLFLPTQKQEEYQDENGRKINALRFVVLTDLEKAGGYTLGICFLFFCSNRLRKRGRFYPHRFVLSDLKKKKVLFLCFVTIILFQFFKTIE